MASYETRRLHTTEGGDEIGTTRVLIPMALRGKIIGEGSLGLVATGFSTAVECRAALNPRLLFLVTSDGMATFDDYSDEAQDGSTSTKVILDDLPPLLGGGAIYVAASVPFRGLDVDVGAANGTTSAMSVDYWDGSSWQTLLDTDGTASGGATLAQDEEITFTLPTDWAPGILSQILGLPEGQFAANDQAKVDQTAFWCRITVSVALDSEVELNVVLPTNRSLFGSAQIADLGYEYKVRTDFPDGHSCIEAVTAAGTADLLANLSGQFAS